MTRVPKPSKTYPKPDGAPKQKVQRPRWCSKCGDYRPWSKVRLFGARAGFRACNVCQSRTSPRKPVKFGGKPKRKPSEYKLLLKECDDLARQRAYARGRCEGECGRAHAEATLQWAHGFSRIYHAIRHVDDNGRLLCAGEHDWYTHATEEWREWLIQNLGPTRFEELRARRSDFEKIAMPERVERLKATLKRLKDGLPVL